MITARGVTAVVFAAAIASGTPGCGSGLWPARNCDPLPDPILTPIAAAEIATVSREAGVEDALWLQIERPRGAGAVGGYISPEDEDRRGALVVMLPGASTLHTGRRPALALSTYLHYGQNFRDAGFRLWTLVLDEEAPYGAVEVDQVIDVFDWLNAGGKDWLGVERVYIVGYSTGATAANVANLYVDATAVVSISGLTDTTQLQQQFDLLSAISNLFPCNTGMHQMRVSLDALAAGELNRIDVVSRVAALRNPTLFAHAEDDPLYFASNTHRIEDAFLAELATENTPLPDLQFHYAPAGGHFAYVDNSALFTPVLEYLESFE